MAWLWDVPANGNRYVFTANGGTDDVSVVDLARALSGDVRAEIGRIPIDFAPWGMAATADGRHIIVASGGSQKDDREGNTISIIDVDRAAEGGNNAVVARVLVGTSDPEDCELPIDPLGYAKRSRK